MTPFKDISVGLWEARKVNSDRYNLIIIVNGTYPFFTFDVLDYELLDGIKVDKNKDITRYEFGNKLKEIK